MNCLRSCGGVVRQDAESDEELDILGLDTGPLLKLLLFELLLLVMSVTRGPLITAG